MIASMDDDVLELKADDLGIGFGQPAEEGGLADAEIPLQEAFEWPTDGSLGSLHDWVSY
jgi:hypothetical protein